MKTISVLSAICIIALAQIVSAQLHTESSSEDLRLGRPHPYPIGVPTGQVHTQHISFDDQVGPGNVGTYNSTDSFGVDLYLTFAGYRSAGFSLWLMTTADAAPNISLTAFTYGTTFEDPTQPFASYPMGFTYLLSDGKHYSTPNPSDLGATVAAPSFPHSIAPGTYFLGHLSISLSGLAPGTYFLQTANINSHSSEVTSDDGTTLADNYLPVSTYTITVVPEPSTFALIVTAIGAGVAFCRARLNKR